MTSVLWFRRDLRLGDNPALHNAAADGPAVALFVLDPVLLRPAGAARLAFLYRSLRSLDEQLDGRLVIRHGDPVDVLPSVVREVDADSVHIAADFGPYGTQRDDAVAAALATLAVPLVRTGSPYAVSPGGC